MGIPRGPRLRLIDNEDLEGGTNRISGRDASLLLLRACPIGSGVVGCLFVVCLFWFFCGLSSLFS